MSLLGAAALSAGGSVLGGLLGYSSQKSANKENIALQREINEKNIAMQRETNAQNLAIFNRQLEYNSPAEQRKMMEAAGYNPANLYNGSNAGVLAPSATPMVSPRSDAPQVSPYLGFSSDFANLGNNLASIAAAKKDLEESKKTQLENSVFQEKMALEFKRLGLENEWQKIQNRLSSSTLNAEIEKALNEADISYLEKEKLRMYNAIYSHYGEKEAVRKIEQIEADIQLKKKQGDTEVSQQDLNKWLGKQAQSVTARNAVESWATKTLTSKQAKVLDANYWKTAWEGTLTEKQWQLLTKYGNQEKVISIFKDLKQAEFSHAAKEKAFKEIEKLDLDMDWKAFDELCQGVKSIGSVMKDLPFLMFMAK